MKNKHFLSSDSTLASSLAALLSATFLFSTNTNAHDHVYVNQHNYYYGEPDYHYYNGHHRGHHRHHHKHARHHHHHHYYNDYYPQVRREMHYYGPQYYQPPYGGYREIYYGGYNNFFMGLRSGNASIMIGY